jgi:biopolymer transport protein ExbB
VPATDAAVPEEQPDAAPSRPAPDAAVRTTPEVAAPVDRMVAVAELDGPPSTTPPRGWWDPAWPRRRAVTVTHAGKENLVDFPVPLLLSPAQRTGAAPDGRDLRFIDGEGRPLPQEIERGATGDVAVAWVRLSRIAAGATEKIWVYYGNPAAAAPTAAMPVWPAPYAAVWHFAGDARDATANHHDGSKVQARFVTGPLGAAAALDYAKQEHIGLGTNTRLVSGAVGVTVSFWAQHMGTVHDGQDIVIGIGTASTSGHLSRVSIAISPELGLIGEANPDEGAWDVTSSRANTAPNGEWHYLTAVIDVPARTILLYRDGASLGPAFRGAWKAASYAPTPANRVTIGCEEDESKSFFTGLLDELRVETTARSPEWIAAQARAVSGKMALVGDEERAPAP